MESFQALLGDMSRPRDDDYVLATSFKSQARRHDQHESLSCRHWGDEKRRAFGRPNGPVEAGAGFNLKRARRDCGLRSLVF
jgi:hypothetical protein